jgi:UDP-N-acetylglucosamine/UDP-N-acetylgalactosamine diphosphorylase
MDYAQLKHRLDTFGQAHALAFWDSLGSAERQELAEQLDRLDLAGLDRLIRQAGEAHDWRQIAARAEPPPAIRLADQRDLVRRQEAYQAGQEALRQGRVGAILVAGGQGTRLGFPHPKGMYPVGPISQRSLYQWHIDQLRAVARRYAAGVPLWLMSSPATDAPTRQLMQQHDRFGLPPDQLTIFQQGTLPAVDRHTGRLLLDQPHSLALSPDGHGGMLSALARSGGLDALSERGIRHVYYFQVDNPLITVCDPLLIGYHLLHNSEMTTQVVAKQHPQEKVGNVVVVDGRMQVIEYSDLPEDQSGRRTEDGQAVFWAGSIAVHVFETDFLRRVAAQEHSLPLHRACKQVPYIDVESGQRICPEEPNAIKLERFIFDLMRWADRPLVVEVEAAEEFEPLKNASGSGVNSPETVRQAIIAKHRRWLTRAGAIVDEGIAVEIHPLFALDAEELASKLRPGKRIESDRCFE